MPGSAEVRKRLSERMSRLQPSRKAHPRLCDDGKCLVLAFVGHSYRVVEECAMGQVLTKSVPSFILSGAPNTAAATTLLYARTASPHSTVGATLDGKAS